jgi:hypothetical protein
MLKHLGAEGAFYANKAIVLTQTTTQGRNVQNKLWFNLRNEATCKRWISHTYICFRFFAVTFILLLSPSAFVLLYIPRDHMDQKHFQLVFPTVEK